MSFVDDVLKAVETFNKVSEAKSPMEATAFLALLQEDSSRQLIQSINKLEGGIKNLAGSSGRLEKATYVLIGLTVILALLTGILAAEECCHSVSPYPSEQVDE